MKKKFYSMENVKKLIKTKPFRSRIPKRKEDVLIIEKLPGYFLVIALLVSLYFLFEVLRPFISVIFIAAVLATAFHPVYKWLLSKLKLAWLSSLVSCLFVVLIIIVPLLSFIIMLTNEAVDTYQLINTKVEAGVFDEIFDKYLKWGDGGIIYELKQTVEPFVDLEEIDIKSDIVNAAQALSTFLFDQTANFLKSISSLLFSFILMLFSLYYFFKDGEGLVRRMGFLSPLPKVHEHELFRKLESMVKAIIFGVFLTAVVQGVLGGIGFAIVNIPSPIFWGTAIGFFSLVPVVGTAMVWVPAAILLAVFGHYVSAIFIALWGAFVVGSVDNFLRAYLIGGKAHTYPLLTFFVILGGIFTMGLKGIIVGPLILMVVMSLLHIYEAEYRKVLKK